MKLSMMLKPLYESTLIDERMSMINLPKIKSILDTVKIPLHKVASFNSEKIENISNSTYDWKRYRDLKKIRKFFNKLPPSKFILFNENISDPMIEKERNISNNYKIGKKLLVNASDNLVNKIIEIISKIKITNTIIDYENILTPEQASGEIEKLLENTLNEEKQKKDSKVEIFKNIDKEKQDYIKNIEDKFNSPILNFILKEFVLMLNINEIDEEEFVIDSKINFIKLLETIKLNKPATITKFFFEVNTLIDELNDIFNQYQQ